MAASSLTLVADGLTGLRLALAAMIVPVAWSSNLALTAVLVSTAWVTDVLDGRLARAAGAQGRLGRWDMWADTAVGFCLLVGLAGSGLVPPWLPVVAVVLVWGFVRGNMAAAMLLQLGGYVPLLFVLWSDRPAGWWLPVATAVVIGLVDWRRLVTVNIPGFLHGLGVERFGKGLAGATGNDLAGATGEANEE